MLLSSQRRGLFANKAAPSDYNKKRHFNLSCQGNSHIFSLKELNNITDEDEIDKETTPHFEKIQGALDAWDNFDEAVALTVYVKSKFTENQKHQNVGAVSDGTSVMITKLMHPINENNFDRGQYLKIFGKFQLEDGKIYFMINHINDIELVDRSKVSMKELCKSLESPKKKQKMC
ncbi:hypothetical protein QAD02_001727 [Eretmocerus hayati]|uniref:Uncharacterized protein n=2 Tax=Eretmocerus hayati TaxID=131215 RepID=A0ACC2NHU0_9HYME|nr:hypothetical protein QAD02_008890 [Eretmocerus hayati]KAJ8670468.1 hypothetical protein QAD02_001727 [Eretmocerus hayati]